MNDLWSAWCSGARPPPRYDPASWAGDRRILTTAESANPGRWDNSKRPYLVEPMQRLALHDPCSRVVLLFASQMGKSEIGNNWIGYVVDHAPCPLMMLRPTLDDCEGYSKQRLKHLFAGPSLRGKVADPRARDSGNTLLDKTFPGGILVLAGANSAARLASWPMRCLFADEVDRYPPSAGPEGDPLQLARMRLSDSGERAKELITSTPTTSSASRIAKEFDASSQARWEMPCPHCGEMQELVWRSPADDGSEAHRLRWTGDPGVDGAGFDVWYDCPACHGQIREHHKTLMLAAGRWVHAHPERRTRGYRINALAAPIGSVSWRMLVAEWIAATERAKAGDRSLLRVFVNTRLAQTWADEGDDEVQASPLLARARMEVYTPDALPLGVRVITCGVDVHPDRLEAQVVGWGIGPLGIEAWTVEYRVIAGGPIPDDDGKMDWDHLDDLRATRYRRADGTEIQIALTFVDLGGGDKQRIEDGYRYTRSRSPRQVVGIFGRDGPRPVVEREARKDEKRRNAHYRIVGVDAAKAYLYEHLQITSGPGCIHFPATLDESFFAQLTAEHREWTVNQKGRRVAVWKQHRERNEALDTWIYAYAALRTLEVERRIARLAAPPPGRSAPPRPARPPTTPERPPVSQELSGAAPPQNQSGDRAPPRAALGPVRPYGGLLHGRSDPVRR